MEPTDRLHALDAVRASALLLGIALHATSPYMAGMGWLAQETPNEAMEGVWFVVHIFRMPMFFLMAGFFGRLMIERKGVKPFIKDRAKRIVIPLLAGWPIVMVLMAAAFVLTALATGVDLVAYAEQAQAEAAEQAASGPQEQADLWNWAHLWFLYYLVIFYSCAVAARVLFDRVIDRGGRIRRALDVVVRLIMRGVWGPVLLAAPLAAWFVYKRGDWASWFGIYPPTDIVPDATALIGHGLAFGLGWLLHRQQRLLLDLEKSWIVYGFLALALTVACVRIAGLTPQWEPYLERGTLLVYAALYTVAAWCWIFAFVGASVRFLSSHSQTRRYIADSSYWLYLMHLPVLVVFGMVFQALGWHWSVEYSLTLAFTLAILLLSYHTMVRFTFLGAILNGRRQPRPPTPKLGEPAAQS
jgi:peptidoglycan/LPS O-acetylase OafA/YrhL